MFWLESTYVIPLAKDHPGLEDQTNFLLQVKVEPKLYVLYKIFYFTDKRTRSVVVFDVVAANALLPEIWAYVIGMLYPANSNQTNDGVVATSDQIIPLSDKFSKEKNHLGSSQKSVQYALVLLPIEIVW